MTSSKLKAEARELIRANAPKIILVGLIYIIATTIISQLQIRLPAPIGIYSQLAVGEITHEQFLNSFNQYGILLAFLLGIMLPTISIGYNSYCLKMVRTQDGDYKDLLTGFTMFLKVISLSIVTTVLIMLWSLLFIIPGVVAHYRYRLAYYILLDDPSKGVMQCISESKRLMHGKKVDLFLIDLSFVGWLILSDLILIFIIPIFPIVSVWLTPYYGLTQASYYNKVINEVAV